MDGKRSGVSEERDNSEEIRREKRILIVDDDVDFCETLVDVFELCSYDTAIAYNARQACDAVRSFLPDVALIDIRLGSNSGIDLISEFRETNPATICVVMTAYATTETAIEALQQGAYDYLRKPISTGDLFITLERCFEKQKLEFEKERAEEALSSHKRQLEKFNSRLKVIIQSTSRFAGCGHCEEAGPLLLEEFARNMGAKGGSFFLRKAEAFVLIHALDPGHAPETLPLPLKDNTPFDRAVRTGRAQFFQDVGGDKRLEQSGWRGYEDGSLLVYPLTDDKGEVRALMALHNKNEPPFTPLDKDLGTILAAFSCQTIRAAETASGLRESEERFRAVFQSASDVIFIKDRDLKYVQVNPAMEKLFGIPASEFIGRSSRKLFGEDQFVERTHVDARVLNGETVEEENTEVIQGEPRVFHVVKVPMHDDSGRVIGLCGIGREMPARNP